MITSKSNPHLIPNKRRLGSVFTVKELMMLTGTAWVQLYAEFATRKILKYKLEFKKG